MWKRSGGGAFTSVEDQMLHLRGFNVQYSFDVLDKLPHRGYFTLALALDLRNCND